MQQKGSLSIVYLIVIIFGLGVGVFLIENGTGFLSKALESIGPSKSATIKIPLRSPNPSLVATSSAKPSTVATSSAKPATSSAKPFASSAGTINLPQ